MITTLHTNLDGVADGEQPCKHSGVAINGQDPKHPGQPQQGKEDHSGLESSPMAKSLKYDHNYFVKACVAGCRLADTN